MTLTPAQLKSVGNATRILATRMEASEHKEAIVHLTAPRLYKASWHNRMTTRLSNWMAKNQDPMEPMQRLARGTYYRQLKSMARRIGNMVSLDTRPIERIDFDKRGQGALDHFFTYMDNRSIMANRRRMQASMTSNLKTLNKWAAVMEEVKPGAVAAILPAGLKTKAGLALLEEIGTEALLAAAKAAPVKSKTKKRKKKSTRKAAKPAVATMGA
ncbi:MAG: hypothetical protein Alpg2KO_32380 [Alphaproteobacteria bacterium]